MEFTEERKKQLEQAIVDACISALESNLITQEQMGDISFFVLERIDAIKTETELLDFLTQLSAKWKLFESLHKIEEGKVEIAQEKQAAHTVEDLIKEGNIDAALAAAKSATEE